MSSKFNPCFCWRLKDGCVIIGLWSLIWSIIQLGIFSWRTAAVKAYRDRMDNRRIPVYQSYSIYYNRLGGGGWNHNDVTPEEKIYTGEETCMVPNANTFLLNLICLFIIQILNLISAFALLCASASMIFGVRANSRSLIWPWLPSSGASILCSFIYCILWWVGNVNGYQTTLTIAEFLAAIFNTYCTICIYVHYCGLMNGDGVKRSSKQGKNMKIGDYSFSGEHDEPYSKRSFVDNFEKLAYDNRVFQDETSHPQSKVNLCEIAESQKSISLTKTDRAEDQVFLTKNDSWQEKQAKILDTDKRVDGFDENELVAQDSSKDKFLKEVVASNERTPLEKRLPQIIRDATPLKRQSGIAQGRGQQKDLSNSLTPASKEPENRHRCHKRRSTRSHDRSSDIDDDKDCIRHHRCRGRRRRGSSDDDDSGDHGRREERPPVTERRSRSRSSCGHYERKKGRERSASRGTQAAASDASVFAAAVVGTNEECKDGRPSGQKRSVRNVKREAKARQTGADIGATLSNQAANGAISIPQNIVIPAQPDRSTPQRYQITSEVTISYNSDKSAESSRANSRQAPRAHSILQPTTSNETTEPRSAIV